MAQRAEKKRSKLSHSTEQAVGTFASSSTSHDPTLASLFGSSLGPIKKSSEGHTQPKSRGDQALVDGIRNSSKEKTLGGGPPLDNQTFSKPNVDSNLEDHVEYAVPEQLPRQSSKKRRQDADDDLEGRYMQKLVREEVREDFNRKKRRSDKALLPDGSIERMTGPEVESRSDSIEPPNADDNVSLPTNVPQHESLGQGASDSDLKKASRTVFLGNVSNAAIKSKGGKRALLDHLTSFPAALPKQGTSNKIESLRFRSTAFSSSAVPKKAAFAKKELMDSTTKSTNAYAVYTTELAAREAVKVLNGTVVLDRHLRVDSVAHPTKTDHRRCVFVGNLGFVDDESAMNDADDHAYGKRPRRGKEPADLEEGLWRQFGKAGAIESVRVPRDRSTRVGKGFAYVQFKDPNGVEKALLFDGKKFPPMLPRILRVTRAKHIQKTTGRKGFEKRSAKPDKPDKALGAYRPKIPSELQSLSGRAGKLLGRAGASQLRSHASSRPPPKGISKTPESIVFEGHRASSKHGKGTLRLGGSGVFQTSALVADFLILQSSLVHLVYSKAPIPGLLSSTSLEEKVALSNSEARELGSARAETAMKSTTTSPQPEVVRLRAFKWESTTTEPPRIKELQFFPSKISLTSGRESMSDSNLPNPPPDDSPTALRMPQGNRDPSTPSSTPQINGSSSTILMPPEPGSDGSITLRMAQLDDTPSKQPSNGLRFSPPPPEADGSISPHQLSSQPGTPTSEAGGVPWSAAVGRASLGKSGRVIDRLMGDNDRLRRDKTLATAKLEEELKKSESAKSTLEALQNSNANLQSMHDIDKAALNRKDRKLEEMRAELDAERSRREKAEAEVKITRQEREEAVEKYKKEAMKGQEEARYASTQYDVLSKSYKSMEQVYQRHTQKLRADLKYLQDSTANDHKKLSNLELISEQLRQEGHKSQKSKDRICNELEAFKAEQTKTLSGIKERAKRNDITNEEVLKEVETVLGQMRYVVNIKKDVNDAS